MLTFHLANIDVISKLSSIHYFKTFMTEYDNIHLLEWSELLYYKKKPTTFDIKYHVGNLVLGKMGDLVFINYSRYEYCHLLHSKEDKENFIIQYNMLPWSYKWLLKNEYNDVIKML